jgi:uncharacterized protein
VRYAPFLRRLYIYDELGKPLSETLNDPEGGSPSALRSFDTFPTPNIKFDSLVIFPTSNCNLRCVYCYAAGGETQKTIDLEFVKKAMDFIDKNSDERLLILFHGGGEPTLEFDLMKKVREYATNLRKDTEFALQTNGVFSGQVRDWILKNIDRISISCDGPPPIQDIQRPLKGGGKSSPIVERNLRYFLENSKNVGVLTTISEFSMTRQTEILEYFNGIGVKRLKFLPVFEMGRCLHCPTTYSKKPSTPFVRNLLKAMELADMYGIELSPPFSFGEVKERFCGMPGKSFILTPDGFVSPCFAVTSNDSDFSELLFGRFDIKSKKILIDNRKLGVLRKRLVPNIPSCQNCFMKCDCAGGCVVSACLLHNKDIFSPDDRYCSETKKIGREILFYNILKNSIKIKPLLQEKSGRLFYTGLFNTFELFKLLNKESGGVILTVDVDKTNLASLTDKIIMTNPKVTLLSFKLTERNLNLKLGKKIEKFLTTLKLRRVNFIITKPIPKCLFGKRYEEIVRKFKIPKNCWECLELFVLRGDSFYVCKTNKKLSQKEIKNRKQIYEFFRKFSKRFYASTCNECLYRLRGKCNGLCL